MVRAPLQRLGILEVLESLKDLRGDGHDDVHDDVEAFKRGAEADVAEEEGLKDDPNALVKLLWAQLQGTKVNILNRH